MSHTPTAYIYLHTHWDREWYLPFEVYRTRLLSVVRSVIEQLQSGQLPNFLLDGQASVLEDVLEIDPSLGKSISELMHKGVLAAGPWYVLADQMLVSGESLIRNLKLGLEITSRFGTPAMIGYCPDTFGHSADLPRILKGFNIDSAFVWRGVPKTDGGPLFKWQSPDGSSVLAYHLSRGYYQTSFHTVADENKLSAELLKWLSPADPHFCKQIDGALVPVGGDHVSPPKDIAARLAKIKAPHIVPITLPKFSDHMLNSGNGDGLAVLSTELRDNSSALMFERAYLLQGVLSSRLYLKRANRIAEHRIVSLCEPLHVQLALMDLVNYPFLELKHAWKLLLLNHPHDSICGCSIDSVHREMEGRSINLHEILNSLDAEAACSLAASQGNRSAQLSAVGALPIIDPAKAADRIILFNFSGEPLVSPVPFVWATEADSQEQAILDDPERTDIQIVASEKRAEIFSGAGAEPVVKTVNVHHGWLWGDKLPAFGGKSFNWSYDAPDQSLVDPKKKAKQTKRVRELVSVEKRSLTNEFLSLEIGSAGNIVVTLHETRHRTRVFNLGHTLRDVADCGDSYNFDPLPADTSLQAKLTGVKVGLQGPLVASLLITYELKIPEQAEQVTAPPVVDGVPDSPALFVRANKTITHKIVTEVSLRRGVPIVFFDTEWENKSRDHRLEVVLDTGVNVESTFAENHYSMIKRNRPQSKVTLPVEKGSEASLDRLPCQRFFIANGQVFFNAGLPEYAVDGSNVALTLLRAFSQLSRPRLQTRGGGAGPNVPTPEGNCLGLNRAGYGWAPLLENAQAVSTDFLAEGEAIQPYKLAELFEGRFWAANAHSENLGKAQSLIHIDNPAVRLMSAYMHQDSKSLSLRLLNVTDSQQQALIGVRFALARANNCKLNDDVVDEIAVEETAEPGQVRLTLTLGKNELRTIRLERKP